MNQKFQHRLLQECIRYNSESSGIHRSIWKSSRRSPFIFPMGVSKFNEFSNLSHARVESKMKLVISDFLQNYFLLLKFLGKLFSGQTNSAVPRTGCQKLEKFRLCPLVGPRPTSLGVHPNYFLSFTTNVDRSFPSHYTT